MRVVVVGSGIAGLTTALHASADHEVILVTGGRIDAANTAWAQGGIAGVLSEDSDASPPADSVDSHIRDTLLAGAGLCAEDAVRVLCTEAPDRLHELIALGVPFDRSGGVLARALEAAHSAPRVLHSGGDATGAAIERVLVEAARSRVDTILEYTRLIDLIVRDGAVRGVSLTSPTGANRIDADAVVLATGGFAGLYAHTSNPRSATGSGIAVAARAGALLADLEFVQFHPTVLAASSSFLVSEAVRGEGAVLRNERGERFMLAVHPDAELAPRDVVARAIAREMRGQGGRPVVLDATAIDGQGLDGPGLDARFPSIARRTREAGYDWNTEPIPVTPAAHYTMGGVATDLDGRTSVPGLFAVGEVARTGVHGANRLASNSLMEGAVFGARVARALSARDREPFAVADGSVIGVAVPIAGTSFRDEQPLSLGELLWDEVGLVRSESGLQRALQHVSASAASGGDRDEVTVAALVAGAALLRRESRGAHARADHPDTDPSLARPQFLRGESPSAERTAADVEPARREAIAC
ncbi:L-aspartate oxidase [Labedella gwakjiensis]|uniref:L-aspartate oxidase n=1 Tax=Labedella gwakjiensis TaxID=390269 RepID=A0A2P8H158_9MICO|nr:L-aspartate oxidase [Labedella gwakjiensis]PSL39938.1 L-aspartate oxidase [Labedella gwakjiensis]RUQ85701.1 L-aspartate oxidase [Labedella gwakjiensis]